jgi:hypothetical protein
MARPSLRTAYNECAACHARIVWPVDWDGNRLPPLNWASVSDPFGTVAVWHTAEGYWLARIIGQGSAPPIFPEKRFRWHRETCQPREEGRGA